MCLPTFRSITNERFKFIWNESSNLAQGFCRFSMPYVMRGVCRTCRSIEMCLTVCEATEGAAPRKAKLRKA